MEYTINLLHKDVEVWIGISELFSDRRLRGYTQCMLRIGELKKAISILEKTGNNSKA